MLKLSCPSCRHLMQRVQRGKVKFWRCSCGGYAVAISSVRKMLPDGTWDEIWPTLRAATRAGPRACPSCSHSMDVSTALEPLGGRALDVCDRCRMIWFDAGELETMPKRAIAKELSLERRQAIGRALAAAMSLEYDLRVESIEAPIRGTAAAVFWALARGLGRLADKR